MKIDLVGPADARSRHGPQRGRRLRRRRRHRARHRLHRRAARAAARAVLPRPRLRRARPRALDAVRPRDPRPRPPRSRQPRRPPTTTSTTSSSPARCSRSPPSARRRCRRAARPGWSTTSTTASPGACSRSSSPSAGLSVGRIGVLAALYPAVWGLGQLVTGALSDRIGRKWLIAGGMLHPSRRHRPRSPPRTGFWPWALGAVAPRRRHRDGLPDAARRDRRRRPPAWRASAVGVYRLWRDAGFAVGALLAGDRRRRVRHRRRHLGRRRAHRRVRRRRRACACTRPTIRRRTTSTPQELINKEPEHDQTQA